MRWNITIPKRATSLALTAVMALGCLLNTPVTSAVETTSTLKKAPDLSLGAAQGYNLVCFGDFYDRSADIQGKSFIGGKITIKPFYDYDGFTFGVVDKDLGLGPNDFGLVWGGTNYSDFNVPRGCSNAKALVNGNTLQQFKSESQKHFNGYVGWDKVEKLKEMTGGETGIDLSLNTKTKFTNFKQQMIDISKNLYDYITNSSKTIRPAYNASIDEKLQFTGTDSQINIFSIDASELNKYSKILLDTPPDSTDIINVVGSGSVTIPLVNYMTSGSNLTNQRKITHLLWNLNSADTISNFANESDSYRISGSVLAPKAKFVAKTNTGKTNNNFEGTLIVDSFSTQDSGIAFEGHNYPFAGKLPSEPILTKTAKLVGAWEDRTYEITLSANNVDSNAVIRDYIDSRFDVVDSNGSVISNNKKVADGTLKHDKQRGSYVEWKNTSTGTLANWEKAITIKAKNDFIGGNNIPTNGDQSGIYNSGGELLKAFPVPTVNVKANFTVNNLTKTIFYGEAVSTDSLPKDMFDEDKVNYITNTKTGSFTETWKDITDSKNITATDLDQMKSVTPDSDKVYQLTVTFVPKTDGTNLQNNSSSEEDKKKCVTAENATVSKNYTVYVVKGKLEISKKIDHIYPAPSEVNAKQSFVFKIQRFDTLKKAQNTQSALDTFYEVITPENKNEIAIKTITGLKKGYYKITEETGKETAAWRYTQKEVKDNDGNKKDQIVNIGSEIKHPKPKIKIYFGAQEKQDNAGTVIVADNPAKIDFTNKLTNSQWLGDTTVVVNNISK